MHASRRGRGLIPLSTFATYRKPGLRDAPTDTGDPNAGGGGSSTGQTSTGQTPGTGTSGGGQTGTGTTGDEDPAATIARLTKELADARADAGKARVNAKQQAADEARQALAQDIGKALGLIKDDGKADPAKLTEQLAAKAAAERDALVRLAVYDTAKDHGGNPAAINDSRTFLQKTATLDPTAPDFAAQVAAAAKEAVDANPTLKAAQVAAAGGVEFTGSGNGAPPRTYTRAQLRDTKFFADNRADIMLAMREGRIKE